MAHVAFIEAYRRIDRYQPGTDFFAWLCAFARNLVRAECEKIQRTARNKEGYIEELLSAQQASALEAAEPGLESRSHFLAECLEGLSREARELLGWRYGDGQRVQAIAQRLGRSPGAVSVQLFGLRKLLRACVSRKMIQTKGTVAPTVSYGAT
jgi:RNA polymerase sigma-70 factor (ECF subfamily)